MYVVKRGSNNKPVRELTRTNLSLPSDTRFPLPPRSPPDNPSDGALMN
jgi:hypothetical protein